MSHKEAIDINADKLVSTLNRLNGRQVNHRDYVFFIVPNEWVSKSVIDFRLASEPYASGVDCAWVVLVVSAKPYLVSRKGVQILRQENNDRVKIPLSVMIKVGPIEETHPVVEQNTITNNMILEECRLVRQEVASLRNELLDLSNELKRKGDHQPVVVQREEQDGNAAILDTIACNVCSVEQPVGVFREKKKSKDKNGEPLISVFTRRTCPACRRKKLAELKTGKAKKVKVV